MPALQNFVNGEAPYIGATWLNGVDVLYTTVFNQATTVLLAQQALGGTTTGIALFQATNAAAAQTAIGATTVGSAVLTATSEFNARAAISAASINGLDSVNFTANWLYADQIILSAGTATVPPVQKTAGTNLASPLSGAEEYDGKVFYDTPNTSNRAVRQNSHFTCLTTNFTGSDVDTAQPFFSSSQDVITLPALTSYKFELLISMSRVAGTTSHTIGILFGGTATFTSIGYVAESTVTVGNVLGEASKITGVAATSTVVTAANTDATENNTFLVKGIMRINGAGTVIPQFIYSAAPGGAPTIRANSYFNLIPIGSNTVASVGNWA